jgi:N-acyl-D-aspartate/D-glutamate deacylase
MAFDTLILDGTVVDGAGKPGYRADVGIVGNRIEAIGSLHDAEAARTIVASGHVVAPGFIDIHSHSDFTILDDPSAESKTYQGVTTEVVGNCGMSPFPVGPLGWEAIRRTHTSPIECDWTDLDGWAARVESTGVSVNIATQVGHTALRFAAGLADDRPPTPDELETMRVLAARAAEQGAFSFTTGLTLPPSSYADTDELAAITEAISAYDGAFYATHAREWAGNNVGAMQEAIQIGRRAGVPVQYSHMAIIDSRLYGHGALVTDEVEEARAAGQDVTYDMYPYTAAGTHLHQLIPDWVQEGGSPEMLKRLRDPATRERAIQDTAKGWFRGLPWLWDTIVISSTPPGEDRELIGMSVEQIAAERRERPTETLLRLIDEGDGETACVMHNMDEDDVKYFITKPYAMFGSDGYSVSPDGVYKNDKPHPRFYGTFPRILGRYVRDQAVMSLPEAVHKMTGAPARRLGLIDRGVISARNVADLVVLDPDTVIDRATFDDPKQYPAGIPHVFVAGEPVIMDGKHTGARPGRVLRRGE